MPSPLVHSVLPSSCVMATHKALLPELSSRDRVKLFALSIFLANGPDLDFVPALIYPPCWQMVHRNWGHNIFSVTLLIFLGTYLIRRLIPSLSKQSRWLSAGLVLSHLLFDMAGKYKPNTTEGVPLFWPFSLRGYYIPLPIFNRYVTVKHSYPLFAYTQSPSFWYHVLHSETMWIGILFTLWCAGTWIYTKIRGHRGPRLTETIEPASSIETPVESASLSRRS